MAATIEHERSGQRVDVPDAADGVVVEGVADGAPKARATNAMAVSTPTVQASSKREAVLLDRRPVLLDAVDAVEATFELAQRGGGRRRACRSVRAPRRGSAARLPPCAGVVDRRGEHLTGRPRHRVVDGADHASAPPSVAEGAGQADDDDDALDEHERGHEGERAGVAEPVGDPQPLEGVGEQLDAGRCSSRIVTGVVAGQLPGLGDDGGGAHAGSCPSATQTRDRGGLDREPSGAWLGGRSPPSSS